MAKLGYTFYPKDWSNSEAVFELTLEERGLYRELIDLAMLNDNKTVVNFKVWIRKYGASEEVLESILHKLVELKLIKIKENKLFIFSCEVRLSLVRRGQKGGKAGKDIKPNDKPNEKPIAKPNDKQIEREREREIEIEVKEETSKKSPPNKKLLFEDSTWSEYKSLRDTLLLDKDFIKKYKGVDLKNYIESAALWSSGANAKDKEIRRTNRGWLSTLRGFMKRDLEKGELKIMTKNKSKQVTLEDSIENKAHYNH